MRSLELLVPGLPDVRQLLLAELSSISRGHALVVCEFRSQKLERTVGGSDLSALPSTPSNRQTPDDGVRQHQ